MITRRYFLPFRICTRASLNSFFSGGVAQGTDARSEDIKQLTAVKQEVLKTESIQGTVAWFSN
jgi:hypothetical protein